MRCLPKFAVSATLMLSIGLSIACSRHPTDQTITKDIQNKVAADPDTKDSSVTVTAKAGQVTLSGTVKSPVAQQKMEQIAHAEPGAVEVDDQTTVVPDETPSEPSAQTMASAPTPAPAPAPPVEKPRPQPIVIPAGSVLTVRTGQALGSKISQTGQTFLATLAQPLSVAGRPALPAGSTVSGSVVTAKAKGKIKGEGQLDLTLTSISVGGHTYRINTSVFSSTEKGKGKRTAATTGGGAAGGALIGGIAGGGKGAGIGALVGAGAGLIGGAATGNKQIEIPAESALSFTLSAALTLPPPGQ
jgi:BON domain